MNEAQEWKLPRPAVVRSEPASEDDVPHMPLTAAECHALRCHPRLRGGIYIEVLTEAEMQRALFTRWLTIKALITEAR